MGCCGQQRAVLVQEMSTTKQKFQGTFPTVDIRFLQPSTVLIRGPVTGRHYQFHGTTSIQRVDSRDAAALIKSGYFQQG
jgi:hypothetical protein